MSRTLINISFQYIVLSLIMMSLLSFIVIFSVLRTRPPGELCFTVEAMAVSTPSHLVARHRRHHLIMLCPVLRLHRLSGTSVYC